MAAKKIKAEVRVNDPYSGDDAHGIDLILTAEQASRVLDAVVSGENLNVNLMTNGKAPSEKFDYAS